MSARVILRGAILALAIVLGAARGAGAYPQFQLSLDEDRCAACHLSPDGGGLLNDYGRDAAGTAISRSGDGRFLHGLWSPPSWLALGADARLAVGDKQNVSGNQRLAFPMQLDGYVHATAAGVSLSVTVGVRGAARDPTPPLLERLVSREHYASYERGDFAVRAGRFFPAFGLRLADHTAYVRRFLGFGLLEEPYAVELSRIDDRSEIRIAGFVPPPIPYLSTGYRARGAIAAYERHVSDTAIVGGQARFASSDDERRYSVGGIGKWWMRETGLLWLAELDLQRQTFQAGGGARTQLAGYLGASIWATRGVLVTGAAHLWDPDLALRASSRTAFEADVQYFPLAHTEVHLLTRGSAEGGSVDDPGFLALLQLHYYL